MKLGRLILVVALCTTQTGCPFLWYGVRNLVEAPINCKRCTGTWWHACREADKAWKAIVKSHEKHTYSSDYAAGFKRGYVDCVRFNGVCEPPGTPPWCYRGPKFETPAGHRAIEDWYAGFRHGSTVAYEDGSREWITLPLPLAPYHLDDRPLKVYYGTAEVTTEAGGGTADTLPAPRVYPPGDLGGPAGATFFPRPGYPAGTTSPAEQKAVNPSRSLDELRQPPGSRPIR